MSGGQLQRLGSSQCSLQIPQLRATGGINADETHLQGPIPIDDLLQGHAATGSRYGIALKKLKLMENALAAVDPTLERGRWPELSGSGSAAQPEESGPASEQPQSTAWNVQQVVEQPLPEHQSSTCQKNRPRQRRAQRQQLERKFQRSNGNRHDVLAQTRHGIHQRRSDR